MTKTDQSMVDLRVRNGPQKKVCRGLCRKVKVRHLLMSLSNPLRLTELLFRIAAIVVPRVLGIEAFMVAGFRNAEQYVTEIECELDAGRKLRLGHLGLRGVLCYIYN